MNDPEKRISDILESWDIEVNKNTVDMMKNTILEYNEFDYKINLSKMLICSSKDKDFLIKWMNSNIFDINKLLETSYLEVFKKDIKPERIEYEKRKDIKVIYKTVDMVCKKCSHNRGFFTLKIVACGDEPKLLQLTCEKCGNIQNM